MKECIYGKFKYYDFVKDFIIYNHNELENFFSYAQNCNHYFIGYVQYANLQDFKNLKNTNKLPLAHFAEFKNKKPFIYKKPKYPTFAPKIISNLNLQTYRKKIAKIKNLISQGHCYQINFTHNLKVHTNAKSKDIFLDLLAWQNTAFRAFIEFDECTILSFSPELFFSIENNILTTKPMKGTIKRSENKNEDKKLKAFLKNDIKNISENLMIVDLVRNDLHKISQNVKVEKLFYIEKYKSLYQMTSTIKAQIDRPIFEAFENLFPCGSITGAPKISVMQNLKNLEDENRQIYCGALGMIHENDCIFSIPIRTLVKYQNNDFYTFGTGSGIVWDSEYKSEFFELILKSSFLKYQHNDFYVLETMLLENKKIFLQSLHLKRLKKTLIHFNITYNIFAIKNALNEVKNKYNCQKYIIRLKVFYNGAFSIESTILDSIKTNKIGFVKQTIISDYAIFKTSNRAHLKKAEMLSAKNDAFDFIYFDENNKLLEGSRSNIVLEINNIFYTPKLQNNLFLGGTFREHLLETKKIFECDLFLEDLKKATNIFCINSVRKWLKVEIIKTKNHKINAQNKLHATNIKNNNKAQNE